MKAPPAGGHIVFPFTEDARAVAAIADYARYGLESGEAAVLILTQEHRTGVESALSAAGLDLSELARQGRFLCFDARETLNRFMVDGMPDRERFRAVVQPLIGRARGPGRAVRAFGEMVGLLFLDNLPAADRLEQYWNELLAEEGICLLCAYPLEGQDETLAEELCAAHSHYMV
ncbi:MAG TPA: MEDS domain-containing protein [Fimbriimonadaceae bacterium]|nr:MEDS domain-containing protein [Fimbriimonadaceae bacterium]